MDTVMQADFSIALCERQGVIKMPSVIYGPNTGPWHVASYGSGLNWWIYQVETHERRLIGPSRSRGANYYDQAIVECEKLNQELKKNGD